MGDKRSPLQNITKYQYKVNHIFSETKDTLPPRPPHTHFLPLARIADGYYSYRLKSSPSVRQVGWQVVSGPLHLKYRPYIHEIETLLGLIVQMWLSGVIRTVTRNIVFPKNQTQAKSNIFCFKIRKVILRCMKLRQDMCKVPKIRLSGV